MCVTSKCAFSQKIERREVTSYLWERKRDEEARSSQIAVQLQLERATISWYQLCGERRRRFRHLATPLSSMSHNGEECPFKRGKETTYLESRISEKQMLSRRFLLAFNVYSRDERPFLDTNDEICLNDQRRWRRSRGRSTSVIAKETYVNLLTNESLRKINEKFSFSEKREIFVMKPIVVNWWDKKHIPSPYGSTGWSLTRTGVYDETQYKLRELNAAGVRDFERFSLISATCTSHLTFAAVTNFERRSLQSSQNKRELSISASLFIDLNSRNSHPTASRWATAYMNVHGEYSDLDMNNRNRGETLANSSYFSSFVKPWRNSSKLHRDVKNFVRCRRKEKKLRAVFYMSNVWIILRTTELTRWRRNYQSTYTSYIYYFADVVTYPIWNVHYIKNVLRVND